MKSLFVAVLLATTYGVVAAQAQAANPSRADKHFVTAAGGAGLAEVQAAQLATQKSGRQDVKDFAQRMITDHTKAGDQLKQIADSEGLSLPTAPGKGDTKAIAKLQGESGAAFDADYIKGQRSAHNKAVKLFSKESASGQDATLKSFAGQTLPTLQDHQKMIKAMPVKGPGKPSSM